MSHTVEIDQKDAWNGGKSPFGISYGKIFMWFFLISDALTFGGLLMSYGFIRHKYAEVWPKAEHVFTHFPFVEQHLPPRLRRFNDVYSYHVISYHGFSS